MSADMDSSQKLFPSGDWLRIAIEGNEHPQVETEKEVIGFLAILLIGILIVTTIFIAELAFIKYQNSKKNTENQEQR